MASSISLQGLSGYDFSGIITQMVDVYKLPENQMKDNQDKLTVQKNAWREVNTRLKALNDSLTSLHDSWKWNATKATVANTTLLSAATTSNAISGSYNIKIQQLAQAQTVSSAVQVENNPSAVLPSFAPGTISITVNGQTKSVDLTATDNNLNAIATKINAANAGVKASVLQAKDSNGQTGYVLALTNSATGSSNAAAFSDVSGSVLADLGLTKLDQNGVAQLNIAQSAQDAILEINGIKNISSSTNAVTTAIPGVTLNLTATGTTSLNVEADYSVAQKAVQDFIDKYNSAMDYISSKLSYDKDTKKAGELFGDSSLQSIQARLRSLVTGSIKNPTGPYDAMSLVGIKTTSATDATLTFDTNKFTSALQTNAQSVANLFSAPYGGVTPLTDSPNAEGIANILNNYLTPQVQYGGLLSEKVNSYDSQIKDIQDRIDNFEDRASSYEESLKARFAALESMLTGLNQQSSWLSSQMNAMSKSK